MIGVSVLINVNYETCDSVSVLCVQCPGPVFVEFPIDTLYPYKLVEHEAGVSGGKTIGQKLVNMFVLAVCIWSNKVANYN